MVCIEKPYNMDDLGYHCFRKHPYSTFALRPVICPGVIFRSSVLNRDEWIIRQFWSLYWWFPMVLERNQPYFRKIFNIHIYIQKRKKIYIPWGSMYGIYIYLHLGHVGKYTIHGSSGIYTWKGPYWPCFELEWMGLHPFLEGAENRWQFTAKKSSTRFPWL